MRLALSFSQFISGSRAKRNVATDGSVRLARSSTHVVCVGVGFGVGVFRVSCLTNADAATATNTV